MVEEIKSETKYKCGRCGCEYPTKEEAEACEKKVSKNVGIWNGGKTFNDWDIGTVIVGGTETYDHEPFRIIGKKEASHSHTQYPVCEAISGGKYEMWHMCYGRRLDAKDIARLREFADLAEKQI